NGHFYVVDEGSRNGTLLNGKLVQRAELAAGDLIEIGQTRVFFESVDEERLGRRTMRLDETGSVDEENLLRLQRTARALNSELDPPKLFEMIVDHAIDIAKAERGFLLLRGSDGTFDFAASRNF